MTTLGFALEGAWKVLLAGLVLGAGLPALFAVGVRALAHGQPGDGAPSVAPGGADASRLAGRLVAVLCFAVVVLAVALGITYIVATGFGKTLSFEHLYPTLVPKK